MVDVLVRIPLVRTPFSFDIAEKNDLAVGKKGLKCERVIIN